MSTSISFDRAAAFYDRTREFPAEAAAAIGELLEAAGPGALILDVGTGTGRISIPMLEHGANLIGCDISRNMMTLLRQKYAPARLVEADASQLPFPRHVFDAVTTCHVMHLVAPWREALREYRRVIRPGGVYINVQTQRAGGESIGQQIRSFWEARVRAHGADTKRPGVEDDKDLTAPLLELGATYTEKEMARYSRSSSVREVVDSIANRVASSTWVVPDDVFAPTVDELREWATAEFPNQDARFQEGAAIILQIARFEAPADATRIVEAK